MDSPINFLPDARSLLLSAKVECQRRTQELQTAIKAEENFHKILAELDSFLTRGWPFHTAHLLKRETAFFREHCENDVPVLQALEQITTVVQQMSRDVLRRYPALLEEACEKQGLRFDRSSRHPEYTFDRRFFKLRVEKTEMAILSNYERKLAQFPADIEAVIEKVTKEHTRVFGRPFKGEEFLGKLRTHYLGILYRQGQLDGADVPLRRMASRVTSERRSYRIDEFLVDLARLARNGPFEVRGRRLELQETTDSKQGMLLHDVEPLGCIGSIRFSKVRG